MSDGTAEIQPGPAGPPPEAVLLRLVRKASGASLQQAARAAGISKAWLSSIETGHDSRARYGDGTRPVRASDEIIARLALFLRISPERLETEGQRPDASAVLREMLRQREGQVTPLDLRPQLVREHWDDDNVRTLWGLRVTEDQRLALIDAYLDQIADGPAVINGES